MKESRQEELTEKYDPINCDEILFIKEKLGINKFEAIMFYLIWEQTDFLVRIDSELSDLNHKVDKIENQLY